MLSTLKLLLAATAFAALCACGSTHSSHAAPAPDAPPEAMDEAEMMAKMMKLATPGPQHAELAKMVGTWDHHYRIRWSPDEPWMETTGVGEVTSQLGGRFVMEKTGFEMMGMPMEGLHLLGYDNMEGQYLSLWADSMSTWWITSTGQEGPDGSVNFSGTMVDMAGKRPFRMAIKSISDTESVTEMYDSIPPAGEVLVMTIHSTKRAR
jgi:hypothetical protein